VTDAFAPRHTFACSHRLPAPQWNTLKRNRTRAATEHFMKQRLRVGILGLGPRWRRQYASALRALPRRFQVTAVGDPIHSRALAVARRLGCQACAGTTQLLESASDALLLLDAPWSGLWTLERACDFGKPVFCAVPLDADADHVDQVCKHVRASRLPVMMALPLRSAPGFQRLRELLHRSLGPARIVLCQRISARPTSALSGGLTTSQCHELVDACSLLLEGEPHSQHSNFNASAACTSLMLEWRTGQVLQIIDCVGPVASTTVRLQVVAERGIAQLEFPRRLSWTDATGRHVLLLRRHRPAAEQLLERFYEGVTSKQPLQPTLEDAYRTWQWLRGEAM
jgi:predicted dehydrogenase